ncbi:SPOR domain-containing protein [Neolewinella lacunae]|uniref:Tetratricopeptide repeat protein n=1 Tax=Neolewinella lacunae TaxID=1517758 RepID=A0A923PKM3_9BACT|nr:SPOR domain-containing protein [Neolewinella lacunae]MBC6995790.1 tetratricopeptide repeat protein [Neolewinella lacunae]MDN3636517.1 SPOR domain-containing protein [Neolewinella lacunae]
MSLFPTASLLTLLLVLTACGGPRPAAPPTTDGPELPYKKLVQSGEAEERSGNFLSAAHYFRRAYAQRPRDQAILYRAAERYVQVRDYRNAADALHLLEPDEDRWPLLGLQLGRALKQDGRYEEARRELALFLETYNGGDRPIVAEIVRNELAGITLARQRTGEETLIDIDRPGRGINTSADEFGAVAVAGDQLFFTSTAGGQSRLYQSRLQAKEWTKATVPPGFPVIAEGTFGTGSLSPDGRIFFFTICSGQTGEEKTNRCEIFRGERSTSGNWSQPEPLDTRINLPGSNNAYPCVVTAPDGSLALYFASDRPGGRGGMDLYLAESTDPANPSAFSDPANLGTSINTLSNEITPAYDAESGALYFASNGHPGYGGLDIFRSHGTFGNFQSPVNLGEPVNSAADDYGLSLVAGGGTGYLTSNRAFPPAKPGTTETDIFTLNFRAGRARLKATVYDNTTGGELPGVEVELLEIGPTGSLSSIAKRTFPTGVYTFDLQPGARYRVLIRREGYQGAEYQVSTSSQGSSLYGQPVFLRRQALPNPEPGSTGAQSQVLGPGLGNSPSAPSPGLPPTTPPASPAPNVTPPAPASSAPATAPPAPVVYRIQISAEGSFDPAAGKYEAVRAIGDLASEPIPGQRLLRITVGYFTDPAAAKNALAQVHARGFPTAFVVRYDAGVRYGRVRL